MRQGYSWKSEELDWAKQQVIELVCLVHFTHGGAWEEWIFAQMVERTDTKWWWQLSRGLRAILTSRAIEFLVADNTLHVVPGKTQTTGRRCFRFTNALVRLAEAL